MGMTVSEAILTLNANVIFACERSGFDSTTVKMVEDALDTIEDALKAQEPVEPVRRRRHGQIGYSCFCGMCGYEIGRNEKYCALCGRPVKWG